MEEKILIKSKQYDISKMLKMFIIIGVILSAIIYISIVIDNTTGYEEYLEHQNSSIGCGFGYKSWEECWWCEDVGDNRSLIGYGIDRVSGSELFASLIPLLIMGLVSCLIYFWLHSYELTVTDKRIYGKVAWGKRVDLPLDSVSATATVTLFKGVSVSTSSGRISFLVMKNAAEIYKTINELLIKRQNKPATTTTIKKEVSQSNADELKKYKDLLDMGIISQEEFDAKKKQLLGL